MFHTTQFSARIFEMKNRAPSFGRICTSLGVTDLIEKTYIYVVGTERVNFLNFYSTVSEVPSKDDEMVLKFYFITLNELSLKAFFHHFKSQ